MIAVPKWWGCPNTPPCPHAAILHDLEDSEDTPPCCVGDCRCGESAEGD